MGCRRVDLQRAGNDSDEIQSDDGEVLNHLFFFDVCWMTLDSGCSLIKFEADLLFPVWLTMKTTEVAKNERKTGSANGREVVR